VAEFGGNESWGYNPTFHFALDKAYGPREKFKQFVEEAHSRGIAVIMDVVYNHIDSQSPLRQLYSSADASPFLQPETDGLCGAFFEELNQSSPFIKNYIDRANRYWVEEFNVDGFRYDLAKCIADGSGDPVAGWKNVADHVWDNVDGGTAPYTYMILEFFGTTDQEEELANYRDSDAGGMASWQNLNAQYNQSSMGYFNDNANIEPAFFGFANFNDPTYMPYMESHDEQWLMQKNAQFGNSANNGYDVKELQTALDRQKLVGSFFFTLPGPRMTWQFAELGYGFKPDECLEDDGGSGICSPQAPGRTQPKPIRWEYRDPQQSPGRVDLYQTWQALLRLRNDNPELFAKDPGLDNSEQGILMSASTGEQVRCIRLRDENLDATILGNFGVTTSTATLGLANGSACSFSETGTWHNFFESDTVQVNSARSVQLRPGEFRIYTSKQQTAPPMGLVPGAPTHRSRTSVSSDGTVDFGATGVDINFSGVSNSGTITVEKLDEPPLNTSDISKSNVSEYRFVIESEGDLSFDDQTEVRFDVSTLGGISDASNVAVYSRPSEDTGSFSKLSTSYNSEANELVAKTGSFSEFVLASDSEALPVELAGFEAALTEAQTVRLSWQTAGETNNAGFQVQRRVVRSAEAGSRAGAGEWTDVDFVGGAGTTDEAQTYRFTDEVPFEADSVRYRLKQVDTDGSARLTDAVSVRLGTPDRLTLRAPFPNPVRGQATIRYAVPERQDVSLELFDVMGRRVRTLTRSPQEGRHERQLDASGLSSGMYILRLRGTDRVETRRITVVK
jgi:glycosidase